MANILYDLKKTCYRYDEETYKYVGEDEAILDTRATIHYGKPIYIVPDFCTMVELPPFDNAKEVVVFNTTMNDWVVQSVHNHINPVVLYRSDVVFSDINTRIINYEEDVFLSTDAQAVFQSVWRLFTTEEGEIPYYRIYGCRMKKFLHYPLTSDTADTIFDYLTTKVEQFETRAKLVSANAEANISNNVIKMQIYVQVKASGETGVLPDLLVNVNRK